ncbi:MAG TPA: DUF433 domain-containing protein [Oculatellaceae cyanobacterium]
MQSSYKLDPWTLKRLLQSNQTNGGGKPCIRGLRITVIDVLEYLAGGMSVEDILTDFPDLTAEDIRACLAFAAERERKLFNITAA